MRLGIDASNIRAGGGVTHLYEILRSVDPGEYDIDQIIVWSGKSTLSKLENKPWLEKNNSPLLEKPLPFRVFWQFFILDKSLKKAQVDFLFVPGGIYLGKFNPFVTMSQNLLPFDDPERKRFGLSLLGIKLLFIKFLQKITFQRADGVIFLTNTAKKYVFRQVNLQSSKTKVIAHGVSSDFRKHPVEQESIASFSDNKPFRWLYISTVSMYKHQWNVVMAVDQLKKKGYPMRLDLIGLAHKNALKKLVNVIDLVDPNNQFINYHGSLAYSEIANFYHNVDGFIFASSCETFGQILLEAMSSGLPIACSDRSVMPEVLGNAGEYFDPEDPSSIAQALIVLMENPELRKDYARTAYKRSLIYSWNRSAEETFSFIKDLID